MSDWGDLAGAGEVVPKDDVALPERGQRNGRLLVVEGVVVGEWRWRRGVVVRGRRGRVAKAVILLWAG